MTDAADSYIVDEPLPDYVNFDVLNQTGIASLKRIAGNTWTNYNTSDPGVTILEQLCYALTELGYCAQFPTEDILSGEDGRINVQGQFFEPQDILTTSPITADDYRRVVYDTYEAVRAVYIEPVRDANRVPTGVFETLIALNDPEPADKDTLLKGLQTFLNQRRNLCETFNLPSLLGTLPIELSGDIVLAADARIDAVKSALTEALRAYAAPRPSQRGYQALSEDGWSAGQIFDGPVLQGGWMPGQLPAKRTSVSLFEITQLIAAVDGVTAVRSIALSPAVGAASTPSQEIPLPPDELADFVFGEKLIFSRNDIQRAGRGATATEYHIAAVKAGHEARAADAGVDRVPPLPEGRYRDVASYFSIQNTMPEAYGTGVSAGQANGSKFSRASARQLKGYLMPFDQILANEFSQLAKLGDLFSFRPPKTHYQEPTGRDPSKTLEAYRFATTYFSQPLYDVPDVRGLLRGSDIFEYGLDVVDTKGRFERDSWKRFREFPYNEYVLGMRDALESDSEACERRDAMLSHLLARHGIDPAWFDDIVDANQWYGSRAKTRILAKSVWLQNFQFLSYHRNRGFDFTALCPAPRDNDAEKLTPEQLIAEVYPIVRGELDQAEYFARARLSWKDLSRVSTYEMILDIMLGLTRRYRLIAANLLALTGSDAFREWLAKDSRPPFRLPGTAIEVVSDRKTDRIFEPTGDALTAQKPLITVSGKSAAPTLDDYRGYAEQLIWLADDRRGLLLIEHPLLMSPELSEKQREPSWFDFQATLIFPSYVDDFVGPDFPKYLALIQEKYWPAHLRQNVRFADCDSLGQCIAAFKDWRGSIGKGGGSGAELANLIDKLAAGKGSSA